MPLLCELVWSLAGMAIVFMELMRYGKDNNLTEAYTFKTLEAQKHTSV